MTLRLADIFSVNLLEGRDRQLEPESMEMVKQKKKTLSAACRQQLYLPVSELIMVECGYAVV